MKKLLFLLIILVFLTSCSYIDQMKRDITGGAIINEGLNEQGIRLDSGKIDVYFCPRDDCEKIIALLKAETEVEGNLLYMIVEALENDEEVKKYFGLNKK